MKPGRSNRGQNLSNRGPVPLMRLGTSSVFERSSGGGGSQMMTSHLQLQDLDLELALLRRKREIIEQQQSMVMQEKGFNRPSQYNFERAPMLYNQQYSQPQQFNESNNYSQFYDSGYQSTNLGSSSFRQGLKRPATDDVWQTGPKKRAGPRDRISSAPRSVQNRPQGSRGNYSAAKPQPQPRRPGFNPSKVTKPKGKFGVAKGPKNSGPAPKKVDINVEERQNRSGGKVNVVTRQYNKPEDKLEANKPVSRSVLGRLELALGTVFKDLKSRYAADDTYTVCFTSNPQMRVLKQAIRERIRTAMLGKFVGTASEISDAYHKTYPKDKDQEVLTQALKAGKEHPKLPFSVTFAADPEKYFHANCTKLLSLKLDEMFEKVAKLYVDDPDQCKTMQEVIDGALIELGEEAASVQKATEENNEEKIDDSEVNSEEKIEATEVDSEVKTEATEVNSEELAEATGEEKIEDKKEVTESEDNNKLNPDWFKAKYFNRLFDSYLKRRLPALLHKYKDTMIGILHRDAQFVKCKMVLFQEAMKILEKRKQIAASGATATNENPKPARTTWPYFVRVIGRPALPKRALMQTFLEKFNPKTIKRHRVIHNLLFVGLASKEDFDNIMAATKTKVGESTITVKNSDNTLKTPDLNKTVETVTIDDDDDADKTNISKDSDDLDNQITDLLTSIREDEDNNTAEDVVNESGENGSAENTVEDAENNAENTVEDVNAENGAENTAEEFMTDNQVEGENREDDQVEGENVEDDQVEGENVEGDQVEGENVEDDQVEGENGEDYQVEGENVDEEMEAVTEVENNEVEANEAKITEVKNIEAKNKEVQNIQAKNKEVQNIQAKNKEVQNIQAKNKEEQNIQAKNKEVQNIQAKNKEVQNIQAKNKEVKNIGTKNTVVKNIEAINKEVKTNEPKNKEVESVKNEVKETGRSTPTRAAARKATSTPSQKATPTPSQIKTRRTSKLAPN